MSAHHHAADGRETHAIRFTRTGGPEVLSLQPLALPPAPPPGHVRIRIAAAGINFIDIYHRTGLYPLPHMPSGLGLEGAGTVIAMAPDVRTRTVGERVGFCTGPIGAYAGLHDVPADRVVRLPDTFSDELAASVLLKGMTAQYLLKRTYPVQPGDVILIHAAAGGVGQIACQWAKALGCTVIGTVGSAAKIPVATAVGCDHVVLSGDPAWPQAVRALAPGGVAAVYDSIGKDTFMGSLDVLRPRGVMVSFGNASGAVPAFEPGLLSAKGSLYLTRPTLFHYTATAADLQATADDLFAALFLGKITVAPPARYALADAARAHADLEGRRTTGALVLVP